VTDDPPLLGFGLPVSGEWATPEVIRRVAWRAEDLGFASLWTFQRVLSPVGADLGQAHASVLDSVAALAYAAACTERIRIGSATICAPFVAPVVLAKALASLDVLSGGRLTVGLGAGWLREEYAAAGVPYERRGARFAEYLRCLDALWAADPVEFEGEFYVVPRSHAAPKPVQRPRPPVLVGGSAPPMLRRSGRLADGWIASSKHGPETIAASIERIRESAREARRDPDALRFVARVVPDAEDEVLDRLAQLRAAGVHEAIVDLNLTPTTDLDTAERLLDALAPSPTRPRPSA